jgi:hypothetical protein
MKLTAMPILLAAVLSGCRQGEDLMAMSAQDREAAVLRRYGGEMVSSATVEVPGSDVSVDKALKLIDLYGGRLQSRTSLSEKVQMWRRDLASSLPECELEVCLDDGPALPNVAKAFGKPRSQNYGLILTASPMSGGPVGATWYDYENICLGVEGGRLVALRFRATGAK